MRVPEIVLGVLTVGLVVAPGSLLAEPKFVAAAKKAGLPAQNCQFCHTTALPKKDTFKPEELNDRGKFLLEEKKKASAKEVDVSWLKNYKEK
jgi:hypothetical protein